jgi:hypothetical protein
MKNSQSLLTPEEKIILLLSRLNPSVEVLKEVRKLAQEQNITINYDEMCRMALKNGVGSLLYINLKGTDILPDEMMQKLKNAYLYTFQKNAYIYSETIRILKLLRENGVDAVPLKGAIASEMIFGNPGFYPSADIDILVHPENLSDAERVLGGAGYAGNQTIDKVDLLTDHYHLILQKGVYVVELHWNLVKRYFTIPPDFWWEGIRETEHEGSKILLLSPERYIIYTIFRLFDHSFRPLKFFVLISGIIGRHRKDIDWEKLFLLSKKYSMERLVWFTLRLLKEMLGTEVPDSIMKRRLLWYENLKRLILAGLFYEVKKPHLRMFMYTTLLETPSDFLKMLLRRFFPNSGEIRLRYGLSGNSKSVYAYYVLNPFFVLLKKR